MKKQSKVVKLSTGGQALTEPQFLLQHDGKLYLTVAVREFDPKHAGIQPHQTRDIGRLKKILKSSPTVAKATLFSPPKQAAPKPPPKPLPKPAPTPGRPMPIVGSAQPLIDSGETYAATDPPG